MVREANRCMGLQQIPQTIDTRRRMNSLEAGPVKGSRERHACSGDLEVGGGRDRQPAKRAEVNEYPGSRAQVRSVAHVIAVITTANRAGRRLPISAAPREACVRSGRRIP